MSLFPISGYADGTTSAAAPSPQTSRAGAAVGGDSPTTQASAVAGTAGVKAADGAAPMKTAEAEKKLDSAVDAINRFLQPVNSSVRFSIDEGSGRTLVKVIDTDTNDIIRQFPSKEALAISRDLARFQGLLVNDKA